MDIIIWIVLTVVAMLFTVFMIALEKYPGIYGFGLVISIISMLMWIFAGLSSIDLTTTTVVYNATAGAVEEYLYHYDASWLITFICLLLSIFPFLMILKKIPETWKMEKE